MPKIPLYEQKMNVGTAQGVTIDGSRSVALAGAQATSEYSLMRELVGLGQDFVNQKIELKTNADKSKYALWEDDYTLKKEEERKRLQSEGKTEDEIYEHLTGSDFADSSFKTWSEENDVIVTREMQNDWNEYKSENKKREFISLEKIKLEKNVISIVQKADRLRLEEKHEEADAEIDNLPISPIEKEKYKSQGYYSYYLNKGQKLAIDGNKELLDALQEEALKTDNNKINFSQRQQLEIQFRALNSKYFSTVATKNIPEFNDMLKNNSLTESIIENSGADDNTKKHYKNRLALQDREISGVIINSDSKLYTVETSISDDGKKTTTYNEIKDIPDGVLDQTGTYEGDVAIAVINVLQGRGVDGKGKSQNFQDDLKMLTDLLTATDAEGNPLMSDNMIERVTAPLFKVMGDENKNNIFAQRFSGQEGAVKLEANSFNEVENFAMVTFLETIKNTSNISISKKLDGIVTAMETLNNALELIEDNQSVGVQVTKTKDGSYNYYDYKDDVIQAVTKALRPITKNVTEELMNKYYKSDVENSQFDDSELVGILQEREENNLTNKKRAIPAGKKNNR
jgi:hypothetical protein